MDYPHSIPDVGLVDGKFVDEDVATGTIGSLIPSAWSNAITDEILSTIAAAGLVPDEANQTQLLQAIRTLSTQQAGVAIQKNTAAICLAGGSADALTGNFTPAVTSLTNGLSVYVRAALANVSTTPTFEADGTSAKAIVKGAGAALSAGDIAGAGHWLELQYDQALDRWVLMNPAMGIVPTGRLINIQTFTASGTYTPTSGTSAVLVEVVGGGGAGGGCTATVANQASAGAGGGAGGYACKRMANPGVQTVTIGAGGLGSLGVGTNGGTSSFGSLVSATGGSGGVYGTSGTGGGGPGYPGGMGSGGDINIPGATSEGPWGFSVSGVSLVRSGRGANSKFGAGGGTQVNGAGSAGTGFGSGGSGGACPPNTAAQVGGNGAGGIVIVWEYA